MEAMTELLVVVLGVVTSLIMTGLRKMTTLVDKLPTAARGVIVLLLATPIAWLSGQLGADLPADPLTWDGTVINVILTWLLALGAHAGAKALKPPA